MKTFFGCLLLIVSGHCIAQKGTYKVLQALAGHSLDSLRPMGQGAFVSSVEFRENGVLIGVSSLGTTFIRYSEMERKNRGWNTYTYTVGISEQMTLQLNIAPYPVKNGKPKLVSALLLTTFPQQNTVGYQKYLFWQDQLMKNPDGTIMQPDEKAVKAIYNFGN